MCANNLPEVATRKLNGRESNPRPSSRKSNANHGQDNLIILDACEVTTSPYYYLKNTSRSLTRWHR